MSSFRPSNFGARLRLAFVTAAAICAPALAIAQSGTITGRVVAANTGQPLQESRVFVVGTQAVATTNADGRYTLRTAPGTFEIRVIRVGYVEHEERRALLSGAEILAYPSRAEGFGFPVLEGFAANVPVLTSNTSSLPEVAGEAAVLVDPDDPAAIAAGLRELLGDEDLRNVLRAAGTARVASFTWQRSARETAGVLRHAAQHGR